MDADEPPPESRSSSAPRSVARVALVASVAGVWVLILSFYAVAGASLQSMGEDRTNAPVAAAIAAVVMIPVGLVASGGAGRRSWAGAFVLALAVGLTGGAGLAWVGVVSGSRMAVPIAAALTIVAAATLLYGLRGRAAGRRPSE